MSIQIGLRVDDPDVQDLLAFMQTRFPESFANDHIYTMERAIKLLRISDEYAPTKVPGRLDGFVLENAAASPVR
jgi:hypothetical protein